jgi:hypothetical protein
MSHWFEDLLRMVGILGAILVISFIVAGIMHWVVGGPL